MSVRSDLLDAMQALLVAHSGATDAKVIYAEQAPGAPRPSLPYLTLKLTSFNRLVGHAHYRKATAAIAASLDLGTVGTGALDTTIAATAAGADGNSITVALAADSGDGVTVSRSGTALTIHVEDGVSTVADVEAAIAALAGADDLVGVSTPGTGATLLTAADAFAAEALSGGADDGGTPTVVAVSQRASTLSIQSFGDTALEWLEDFSAKLDLPAALDDLQAAGIAVVELSGGVQDVTLLLGSDFERRGSYEVELHYGTTTDPETEIEALLVELTATLRRYDGDPDTMTATLSVPLS